MAVLERVARLEDRVRDLDPNEQKRSRKRRALFAVLGFLALAGTAVAIMLWLGSVEGQTVMRSNAGHMVTVRFGTTVRDVTWFDPDGKKRDPLVLTNYVPVAHDNVQASSTVIVPDEVLTNGKATLTLEYRAFGFPRRAKITFDAKTTDVDMAKKLLAAIPGWVSYSSHEEPYVYFSTLLAYKYALASIAWGLDDEPLTRSVRFAPATAPGIDRDDEIYVHVPAATRHVRVKIRYKDGTESDVRTVPRATNTLK